LAFCSLSLLPIPYGMKRGRADCRRLILLILVNWLSPCPLFVAELPHSKRTISLAPHTNWDVTTPVRRPGPPLRWPRRSPETHVRWLCPSVVCICQEPSGVGTGYKLGARLARKSSHTIEGDPPDVCGWFLILASGCRFAGVFAGH